MTTPTVPIALTDRHLRIPAIYAGRYRKAALRQRLDPDDLLGVAWLAFYQALALWNPERGPSGESVNARYKSANDLGAFLAQRINWRVRNWIWPSDQRQPNEVNWRRRKSLEAIVSVGRKTYLEAVAELTMLGRTDDNLTALDESDAVAALIEHYGTTPMMRRALVGLTQGKNCRQIGEELGVTRSRVWLLLKDCRYRARKEAIAS